MPGVVREHGGEHGGERQDHGPSREQPGLASAELPLDVESDEVFEAREEMQPMAHADDGGFDRGESRVEEPGFDRGPDRPERGRDRDRGRRGPRREDRDETPREVMPAPDLEAEAVRITGELLGKMGYEAEVTAKADATRVDVHAVVPDGGEDLTGSKGEVRQALQHILNRMINHGGGSTYHLQLEVNDFWERRETELEDLARQLSEEALRTNAEVVTDYLNSQERRIVHVTLRPDTRVKTYALGTGLIKRVAIAPADFPEPPAGEE